MVTEYNQGRYAFPIRAVNYQEKHALVPQAFSIPVKQGKNGSGGIVKPYLFQLNC